MLTEKQVMSEIRRRLKNRKQKDVAEELGISQQYLSDVLNDRKEIGPAIYEKMGLVRVVLYKKVA